MTDQEQQEIVEENEQLIQELSPFFREMERKYRQARPAAPAMVLPRPAAARPVRISAARVLSPEEEKIRQICGLSYEDWEEFSSSDEQTESEEEALMRMGVNPADLAAAEEYLEEIG